VLVLSRRTGEQIVVPGCGVAIKVVAVRGKTIKLGVSAPAEVRVMRAELHAAGDKTRSTPVAPGIPQPAAVDRTSDSHDTHTTRAPSPPPPVRNA